MKRTGGKRTAPPFRFSALGVGRHPWFQAFRLPAKIDIFEAYQEGDRYIRKSSASKFEPCKALVESGGQIWVKAVHNPCLLTLYLVLSLGQLALLMGFRKSIGSLSGSPLAFFTEKATCLFLRQSFRLSRADTDRCRARLTSEGFRFSSPVDLFFRRGRRSKMDGFDMALGPQFHKSRQNYIHIQILIARALARLPIWTQWCQIRLPAESYWMLEQAAESRSQTISVGQSNYHDDHFFVCCFSGGDTEHPDMTETHGRRRDSSRASEPSSKKAFGDHVNPAEVIGEIETDKTNVPFCASPAGIIKELLVDDVGEAVAGQELLEIEGAVAAAAAAPSASMTPASPPPPSLSPPKDSVTETAVGDKKESVTALQPPATKLSGIFERLNTLSPSEKNNLLVFFKCFLPPNFSDGETSDQQPTQSSEETGSKEEVIPALSQGILPDPSSNTLSLVDNSATYAPDMYSFHCSAQTLDKSVNVPEDGVRTKNSTEVSVSCNCDIVTHCKAVTEETEETALTNDMIDPTCNVTFYFLKTVMISDGEIILTSDDKDAFYQIFGSVFP
ncbi:2-oxoglutarate dehydrogenase E2 component (dihydrolipoamide succinyltransferase) [Clonorchis sinensis]|uniref:2-oxoglutarate dehydrogenase E2 component (Dihydrolipoamide succinyltransferase) n=1 Tax=Clonorchis sinensis TaxID=79923 RepID=G7Y5H9_CLOSI|nr:2-oxoglutarate dehydrogenase E2 component (dihydrolipoamide succinyltransferase) [Clonorchis sinensis]